MFFFPANVLIIFRNLMMKYTQVYNSFQRSFSKTKMVFCTCRVTQLISFLFLIFDNEKDRIKKGLTFYEFTF